MKNTYSKVGDWGDWLGEDICPHCQSHKIEYNTGIILASNPPKMQLRCKDCGHIFSSSNSTSENTLDKLWEHDQSILNIPKVGDPPYPNYIGDPIPIPYDYQGRMGWICPKCGRVNSPYEKQCPCSIPNIVYCNHDSGEYVNPNTTTTIC